MSVCLYYSDIPKILLTANTRLPAWEKSREDKVAVAIVVETYFSTQPINEQQFYIHFTKWSMLLLLQNGYSKNVTNLLKPGLALFQMALHLYLTQSHYTIRTLYHDLEQSKSRKSADLLKKIVTQRDSQTFFTKLHCSSIVTWHRSSHCYLS